MIGRPDRYCTTKHREEYGYLDGQYAVADNAADDGGPEA